MNSLNDIWSEIIKILSEELSPTTINTWFLDCTPVELDDCKLVLHTPSEFKKVILNERFLPQIKKALYNLFSTEFEVVILCSEAEMRAYTDQKRRDNELPEIAGYTFDRFVVGPSNKFAHAAAEAVANNDDITYNPLLIYGNSGLGKTHLLLSIGATIHDRYPNKKIVYIKGDQFTNELIKSIREGTAEEFRTKYRNADLFLIDDIQFIAGKPQTQEEFFHTFNNIYEAGHQIVITSDRPPKDMAALDDRLRTRFEGGLLADIEPPDYETRVAIIKNKAAQFGLIISEEAVNYIADNVKANIRQLEGVIKKLTAYKAILNTEIDLEAVKRAIADVIKNEDYIPQPKKMLPAETDIHVSYKDSYKSLSSGYRKRVFRKKPRDCPHFHKKCGGYEQKRHRTHEYNKRYNGKHKLPGIISTFSLFIVCLYCVENRNLIFLCRKL